MILNNGNNYYVVLKDVNGNALAIIPDFFSLEYTRIVNNVGQLDLRLAVSYTSLFQPYYTLEVWRSAGGGVTSMYLDTETIWIITSIQLALDENGQLILHTVAQDANRLLDRRIVAYYASTAQTSKTGIAGDIMKEVVTENISSTANDYTTTATTRGLSATLFSVAANQADGASISMSFSWRKVLSVLQDFAAASTTAGIYMAFDIYADGYNHLEFRTYAGQRGTDHRLTTNNPIILDPYAGNLSSTSLTYDYTDETTFVYAAGQGTDSSRTVATSPNATRLTVSPFARNEFFQDARQATNSTQVQDAADAALRDNRGLVTYESKIIETASNRYGIEYKFGDILPCQFLNQLVDCMLTKVHVSVSGALETIDVGLQSLV